MLIRHKAHGIAIAILVLLSAFGHSALQAKQSLQQQIDRLVQPYLDNDIVVGMTIGVMQNGKPQVFGYGRMSQKDRRVPDGNTVYEIGSTSKVFTGILLADAVTQGRVKLDQAAGELLPAGAKMPTHETRAITLQDLSTHVSGLPRLPDNLSLTNADNPYADYSVEKMYGFLNGHTLGRAPGEKREYSNLGQGLLGHLLALQQETSYERLLRDRIAGSLNMSSTTISLNTNQQSRLAAPHRGDGTPAHNWDIPTLAGAGAIRSTADDLLKFAAANLHPPVGELGEAIELAWKIHQEPLEKDDYAMGLGWHLARDGHTRWHNGQTGGYHCMLYVSRRKDLSVVLLTNTGTREVDELAQDIFRSVLGGKIEPREFEKAIAVAPEIMQRYVGKFQLGPGSVFTVAVEDDKLKVGLTGQPMFEVYARSETEWFYKVVKASLTFAVEDNGECTSLELFQHGVRQKAKRIEE